MAYIMIVYRNMKRAFLYRRCLVCAYTLGSPPFEVGNELKRVPKRTIVLLGRRRPLGFQFHYRPR